MEGKMFNSSARSAGFLGRAKMLLHDWSFPVVLVLAWSLAATYTMALVNRPVARVRTDAIVAPAAQPLHVVHAPVSAQHAHTLA
jgi:hypothetical protein